MKNKLLITLCILCAILLFAPITAWAMTDTPEEETSSKMEVHKVAVITTKVDEEGNPLSGATLQIIDSEGNIVDEWITDGTEHTSLVPEGDYTLHEAEAPEGYEIAEDQAFTVKVEEIDINAGVDYHKDSEVCQDYGGLPFYYIESEGEKEEAYCINQDWEEPEEPKEEEPVTEIVPPKTGVSTTNSENEGILFLLSLCMVVVPIKKIKVN